MERRKVVETSSISKRKKSKSRGKSKHASVEEVGIGKLQDEMLCYILSFLETKDAVRTSVLSKRWRYVFNSVPCIDIQYPRDKGFIDFIDNLLHVDTVSRVKKLCLTLINHYKQLSEWINTVIDRDIEEIALDIYGSQCIELSPTLFTCKKLVILKLNFGVLFDVPSLVYLPSLKILHFFLGDIFHEDSMTNLLNGCPVLEELEIHVAQDNNLNTLFVRSSSLLKSLSLCCGSVHHHFSPLKIVVDIPNVEQLHVSDWGNVQYDINSLSSLVNLNTNIRQGGSGLVELLRKFTNTKYMVISCETIRSLEGQPLDDFPIFHNLTHLVVKNEEYNRTVMPALLECSPNLVTLESYSNCRGRSREEKQHHFKAPKCMMLYLEKIKLTGIKGFMHEMEMISYLLKNSMVLKKLSIQSIYSGAKTHSEISKKLLTFPRSSPKCQIIFDS